MRVHVYRNRPDDDRDWSQLYFCYACNGWYGVPHNDNHCQTGDANWHQRWQCACALCRSSCLKPIEGSYGFFTEAASWQP